MPLSRYDKHYGGKKGSAEKALRSMIAQYGEQKGRQVFYAKANRSESAGTPLRKSVAEHRRKRGRFKKKPTKPGLRGAMAERNRR